MVVQLQSQRVISLYDEMVSDGRMRPIQLDNVNGLRSVESKYGFEIFMPYLKSGCANTKVINRSTAVETQNNFEQ